VIEQKLAALVDEEDKGTLSLAALPLPLPLVWFRLIQARVSGQYQPQPVSHLIACSSPPFDSLAIPHLCRAPQDGWIPLTMHRNEILLIDELVLL
jgi:hypothetical protein